MGRPSVLLGMSLETENRWYRRGLRVVLSEMEEYLHILQRALCRDPEVTVGVHTQVPGGCLQVTNCDHLLYIIRHGMREEGGHGGIYTLDEGWAVPVVYYQHQPWIVRVSSGFLHNRHRGGG